MNLHRMTQVLARRCQPRNRVPARSYGITYSGGQPTEGQGGYYGSGGARKTKSPPVDEKQWKRPQMLALAADVAKITQTMNEVISLEDLLREASNESDSPTSRTIEIKSKMKKICTQPDFVACLNRLEIDGEPVWGLSSDERDLIVEARKKVNDC